MSAPLDIAMILHRHGRALHALAAALVGEHAAGDAVQETALAALRRPPRHGESVRGWLATAVANVARKWRRGERRRLRRERAAARPEAVEDVAELAAHEELLQRLVDAVRGLEVAYREVIWLRFFEGLKPAAIAGRSGVPLATVKSRLQRGLQQLRQRLAQHGGEGEWRTALGAAFGIGGGVGAGVAAATGVLWMASGAKWSAAAAALVVALLAWWVLAAERVPLPSVPTGTAAAAAVAAAPATLLAAKAERHPDAAVEVQAAAPAAAVATVRGRLVAAEDGRPIAGATIGSGPHEKTESDRSGCFALTLPAGRALRFEVTAAGRIGRRWNGDQRLVAGHTEDLGDLPLRSGLQLHGRLLDADGAPLALPEQLVAASFVGDGFGRSWNEQGLASARTDAAGRFAFDEPLPAGTVELYVSGEVFLLGSKQFIVDPTRAAELLEPRVGMLPVIRGVVVDETGAPLRGIGLGAGSFWQSPCQTAADGTFCMRGPAQHAATTAVVVADSGDCDPLPPIRDVAWGTLDLRIVLHRSPKLPLTVVDEDGAPVESFGVVTWRPASDLPLGRGRIRLIGTHPDGRLDVDRVAPGGTVLRVLPREPGFTPSECLEVRDLQPLRVVLARRLPCRVLVLAAERLFAGAEVALLRRHGDSSFGSDGRDRDPCQGDSAWIGPGDPFPELVSHGTTAADGTAALLRDREVGELVLRIRAAGRPQQLIGAPVFPADGSPLRVVLVDCGRIGGTVQLGGRDPQQVRVRCAAMQGAATAGLQPLPLDLHGGYASPPLPAGSYRLALEIQCLGDRGAGRTATFVAVATRTVEVRSGDVRQDFDLQAVAAPATLHGRVLAPGLELAQLRLQLVRQGEDGDARFGEFPVGADGSFVAAEVLPGRWRLAFRIGAAAEVMLPAVQAEVIELQPGETADRTFELVRRRLVVHLRHADGSPARDVRLHVASGGCRWPAVPLLPLWPPCGDTLVFDPAPATQIRFGFDGKNWSEPVAMPADRSAAEVTVVLPGP